MGYMKGMDDLLDGVPGRDKYGKMTPAKADLERPMVTISRRGIPKLKLPGDIPIWMGWPMFNVKLVQFEMNQWMHAAGFLCGFCHVVQPRIEHWDNRIKNEIDRAEAGLLNILEWNRL